jgi:hypothetical protein
MKSFIIKDIEFALDAIEQFYIAVIVKTGYKNETTEVSLKWFESEAKGRVEFVAFCITIVTKSKKRYQFLFKTRGELDRQMSLISSQIG